MPRRIQLSRQRGARKPPDAIVVARPSRWGNPFVVGESATLHGWDSKGLAIELSIPITPDMAVDGYRELMAGRLVPWDRDDDDSVAWVNQWRADLEALRGHDLCCWCSVLDPCHADVLLELLVERRWEPVS